SNLDKPVTDMQMNVDSGHASEKRKMTRRLVDKPMIVYLEVKGIPQETTQKDILTTAIELSRIASGFASPTDVTNQPPIEVPIEVATIEAINQPTEEELLALLPGEENITIDPELDISAILESPLIISANSVFKRVRPSNSSNANVDDDSEETATV